MFRRRSGNFNDAGFFRTLNQAGEVITVRAVSLEGFFVKQAFDATSEANLVRMTLRAYGPAEFAVPAAAKNNDRGGRDARGHQA